MVAVEIALAKVEGRLGVIDAGGGGGDRGRPRRIRSRTSTILTRGTAAAGVPVPALVAQLRRQVGGEAATFVHWGATSQDILDTALVLQLRDALALLARRLDRADRGPGPAGGRASRHADHRPDALPAGRADHVRAQGRGLAGTAAAPSRAAGRAEAAPARGPARRRRRQPRRPSAIVASTVMEALAAELGLGCPPMPWHSQRDGFGELASWLALVTGSLGKLGQDVLLLAQNEVGEVREAEGGGSSTMPQKSNPIRAEALVTLARRNATLLGGMHEAMLHAHERDGAAWQLEWAILPDMVHGCSRGAGACGRPSARTWSSTSAACAPMLDGEPGPAAGRGRELRPGRAPATGRGAGAGQVGLPRSAQLRTGSAAPARRTDHGADRLGPTAPAGGASPLRRPAD